jgi:hypothetical protein
MLVDDIIYSFWFDFFLFLSFFRQRETERIAQRARTVRIAFSMSLFFLTLLTLVLLEGVSDICVRSCATRMPHFNAKPCVERERASAV